MSGCNIEAIELDMQSEAFMRAMPSEQMPSEQVWLDEFERLMTAYGDACYEYGQNSTDFAFARRYISARDALYAHARKRPV